MKKTILAICLAVILTLVLGACSYADCSVTLGYDFSGNIKEGNASTNVNTGLELDFQYIIPKDQLEYGMGVDYQFEREVAGSGGKKFNFIPIYAVLNYNFTENAAYQPYFTSRLGYNFFNANDAYKGTATLDGGLYYAAGFGVNFGRVKAELLYSVDKGSSSSGTKTDIEYSQWDFKMNYKF